MTGFVVVPRKDGEGCSVWEYAPENTDGACLGPFLGEHGLPGRPASPVGLELAKVAMGLVLGLALILAVVVLVRGWPEADPAPADDRTRHAVCELLDTLGADATERADVEACTFTEGGS